MCFRGWELWSDETGSFLEYLVPLLIVGLGAVPIVAGLTHNLNPIAANVQNQVIALTESGY